MRDSDYLEEQRGLRRSKALLIVFDEAVAAVNRDAVTLTTWAAEKHADVVVLASAPVEAAEESRRPQQVDPNGWLKSFERVLLNLGWAGDFGFARWEMPEGDVRAKATELLAHEFEGEKPSMRRQLEQLVSAWDWPGDPCLVGMVRESGDQLSLHCLLVVETRQPSSPAPEGTEPYPRQSQLFAGTFEATLLMLQFERVRAALLKKLRQAEARCKSRLAKE